MELNIPVAIISYSQTLSLSHKHNLFPLSLSVTAFQINKSWGGKKKKKKIPQMRGYTLLKTGYFPLQKNFY